MSPDHYLNSLIIIFFLCERPWSKPTELQVNYHGALHYNSKPEHGMPNLPFKDSSVRRATEDVWFDTEPQEEPEPQLVGVQ